MNNHDFAGQQLNAAFKKWLYTYIRQSWWRIAVLIMLSMAGVFLALLNPWPLKLMADSVFGSVPAPGPLKPYTGTFQLLVIIAVVYVLIYLLESLVGMISAYVGARFGFRLDVRVKQNLFNHILHLPIRSSTRLETGDYIYRQNVETASITSLVLGTFVTIFQASFTIIGVLVVLILLDWRLTILSLTIVPLLFFSLKFFGPRIQRKAYAVEQVSSQVYSHTQESIQNADIVQSYNRQKGQVDKLTALLNQKLGLQLNYTILAGFFGFTTSLLTVLAIVAIVLVGGKAVFNGTLTFGGLLIFVTYAGYLYQPLETLSGAIAGMNETMASLKRVFEVVNDNADLENMNAGAVLQNVKGQIVFQNVTFNYGEKVILKDINLTINPGEKVAFVGPSGAGKSTLLAMVLKFANPVSGSIYIDGQNTNEVNLKSLRDQIAIVDQEPKLFSISIAENIGFSRPDDQYPLPDIMAAASKAFATEFIDKLPKTYDELVKMTGGSLSGGQKQRIAIARALYKNAPILLLDEPTSAQDVASEQHVLDAINHLITNKTVLMVTHKHSLLSQMDKIFVVEDGRVLDISAYGGLDAYSRYIQVHEVA